MLLQVKKFQTTHDITFILTLLLTGKSASHDKQEVTLAGFAVPQVTQTNLSAKRMLA